MARAARTLSAALYRYPMIAETRNPNCGYINLPHRASRTDGYQVKSAVQPNIQIAQQLVIDEIQGNLPVQPRYTAILVVAPIVVTRDMQDIVIPGRLRPVRRDGHMNPRRGLRLR